MSKTLKNLNINDNNETFEVSEISVEEDNLGDIEVIYEDEVSNLPEPSSNKKIFEDFCKKLFLFFKEYFQDFKKLSSTTIKRWLSYSFSIQVILVMVYLNVWSQDENNLAATDDVAIMMNSFILLGISPLFALGVIASNIRGKIEEAEKNNEDESVIERLRIKLAEVYRYGLGISIITAPLVTLAFFFSKDILIWLGQKEAVATDAGNFLEPYSGAVFAAMIRMCAEQLMFSFNHEWAAMFISLINLAIGTALSILLGFVAKLGPLGIALGCVVEANLTALAYTLYIILNKEFRQFRFFRFYETVENDWTHFLEFLKLGLSIFSSIAVEVALPICTGIYAGLLDNVIDQAAWNFVMQVVYIILIPGSAFGQVCCNEVSKALGAKKNREASRLTRNGLLTMLTYVIPIPVAVAIYPKILTFFLNKSNQENINGILKYLMPIISLGIIFDAIRYYELQNLRSWGNVIISSMISIFCVGLGIIFSGLLGLGTNLGIYGIAIGYTASGLMGGLFLSTLLFKNTWADGKQDLNDNIASRLLQKFGCSHWRKQKDPTQNLNLINEKNSLEEHQLSQYGALAT